MTTIVTRAGKGSALTHNEVDANFTGLDAADTTETAARITGDAASLLKANNLSDLTSAPTARTNLGLGSAAVLAASALLAVSANLSDLANAATARTNLGLSAIAASGSASDLISGTVAAARMSGANISTALGFTPFANPMSAGGDLIYGGVSGVATRLANSTAGQFLRTNGTTLAPSWSDTFTVPIGFAGSANTLTVAGSATGLPVTLTASGSDASIPIKLAPKGAQGFVQLGPDTYGAAGWAGEDTAFEVYDLAARTAASWGGFIEKYAGDIAASDLEGLFIKTGTQGVGATQDINSVFGLGVRAESALPAGRTVSDIDALAFQVNVYGGGTATVAYGCYGSVLAYGGSTIGTGYAYYGYINDLSPNAGTQKGYTYYSQFNNTIPLAEGYGFWVNAMGGKATNAYPFWADEQGVTRIRADNTFDSVYQAIFANYNPLFTKYTAGAANFERGFIRWQTNVLEIGAEAGGTGTLRALNLIGSSVKVNGSTFGSAAFTSSAAYDAAGAAAAVSALRAAADGATFGLAAFTAADFNASAGVISIDYTNGQKATGSVPGFLSAADWTTFNGKGAGDALTTNPLSQFAATTSLQLKGVISDETGSGALVFATSPTFVTPVLGTPSSGTLTSCTGLPAAGVLNTAAVLAALNIFTTNGALSAPAQTFNGTWITGGSATTTKPYVLIEVTGATSAAWSTAGTGLGINAATGFTGNLLDLQLNGVSKVSFASTGAASFGAGATTINSFGSINAASAVLIDANNVKQWNGGLYAFSSTSGLGGATDIAWGRNAAGVAEFNNGTLGTYRDLKLRNIIPGATLATTMTDGFHNIAGAAGVPSGVPNNTTGFPMYWDSTNLQIYVYTGGAWKKSAAFT